MLKFACSVVVLFLLSCSAFAVSGTDKVASQGTPVPDSEAEMYGWPEGVLALVNDPLRADGWSPWFSEWPNDIRYYEMNVLTMDDLNHLIEKLANIQAEALRILLSDQKEPSALGFTTRTPRGNGIGAVFCVGSQKVIDEWYQSLPESEPGVRKFGVNSYAEPPEACPPTLTLYVAHETVRLSELRIPRNIQVFAAYSEDYRSEHEEEPVLGKIEAFVADRKREVNVALAENGAVVIADCQYAAFSAEKAIDGRWTDLGDPPEVNRWHSSLSDPHPHWVWVQFKQTAIIDRVVVHLADPIDVPLGVVGECKIPGESTWHEIFSEPELPEAPALHAHEFRFEPIRTNNFRLRINRSSHVPYPNSAQVSEIEVFGVYVPEDESKGDEDIPELKPCIEPTQEKSLDVSQSTSEIEFRSDWLALTLSLTEPRITRLCWDSLGKGKVNVNLLKSGESGGVQPSLFSLTPKLLSCTRNGNTVRYEMAWGDTGSILWEIRVQEKAIDSALSWNTPRNSVFNIRPSIKFNFDVNQTPVAPFCNPEPGNSAPFPCLLHAADYGSLLVEDVEDVDVRVTSEVIRPNGQFNLLFKPNGSPDDLDHSSHSGACRYRCTVRSDTIPFPELVARDDRLEAMPRHWLNVFQYRPDIGILSNNVVSDNAVFCMFTFTDLAPFTPSLPAGIETIELARESLDRYFNGAPGYGKDGDRFTDTNPALLIAAWDVVMAKGDMELLSRWLPSLEQLAAKIEAQDRDGNGLPESVRTGNRGEGLDRHFRTGNWWDCINFGHEDAYVSALVYRAYRGLAQMERLAGRNEQASKFDRDADRVKAVYFDTFYNTETGIIAGWKSKDGELHDYWFTFVNGIAITYGLVPENKADDILNRLQAKMKEVGYDRFDLGLPGNLVPVPKNDYIHGVIGSSEKEDGSDGHGVFENGGATACYAYFYIQALYQTGRREEAEAILWPMMETYAKGGFQNGVGHGGEWRRWDGTPSGYEGFLADAYYTQLALYTGHYGIVLDEKGFRLAPWSPLKGQSLPTRLKFMGKEIGCIE